MRKLKSKKGTMEIIIGVFWGIVFLGIIGLSIYIGTIDYQNEETIEITVKDKYVKRSGDDDLYLVAGDNGETYKIEDLLWKGKFNSTDLYNELTIGERYKITATGIRLQYFSMYKNINKIEKVD